MKSFVAIFALLVVANALPVEEGRVNFEEDTLGNYRLTYDTKESSRTEQRNQDGRTLGTYSYYDPEGVKHVVTYVAAADHGFEAQSADIPQSVPESHELIQTRNDHLAVFNMAKAMGLHADEPVPAAHVLAQLNEVPVVEKLPHGYVPEVDADHHAVRADLLAAYAKSLARLAEEYRRV